MGTFIKWSTHSSDGRADHLASQTSHPPFDTDSRRPQDSKQPTPLSFIQTLATHSTSPSPSQKPLMPVKTSTPIPSLVQSKLSYPLFNHLPDFSLLSKMASKVWAAVRKTEVQALVEEARKFVSDPANQLYGRGETQVEVRRRGRMQQEAITVHRSRRIAARGLLTSGEARTVGLVGGS